MKQHVHQLAAFGGTPLFETPRHVGQPVLPDRETLMRRIENVFDSGWLTNNGPQVQAFESAICELLNVRHCVALCNGTMALQIMARACNLTGEVIVPAMTFIATAHALEWIGLTPVFADVDPVSHTLDPRSVAAAVTSRTTAIMGVHVWGNPCDVAGLQQVASSHRLRLLFDASHAFGCRLNGRSSGSFGDAEAFSFHATKIAHSLEGGAITTNSDDLADRCRLLRNFGITGLTQVDDAGINGKMSEVSAAVGLATLELLAARIAENRANASVYNAEMLTCRGIHPAARTADNGGNAQYVVATVDEPEFGLSRNELLQILRAEGVLARSDFLPGCHQAVPYKNQPQHHPVPLPVTEKLLTQVLQFPTGSAVDAHDIRQIADIIRFAARHAREIRPRLAASNSTHHALTPNLEPPNSHHLEAAWLDSARFRERQGASRRFLPAFFNTDTGG